MPREQIETDRLTLDAIHNCSVDELYDAFDVEGEDVFSLCSWSKHENRTETSSFVENAGKSWIKDEKYRYTVRLKHTNKIVGTTYIDTGTQSEAGILGLWLDKPYWGMGISGERADAIIKMSFEELDLTHVRVGCLSENNKSRRAIEKYISRHGGVFYGVLPVSADSYSSYPQATRPHIEYAIRHEDYHQDSEGIECMIPGLEYKDIDFSNLSP